MLHFEQPESVIPRDGVGTGEEPPRRDEMAHFNHLLHSDWTHNLLDSCRRGE
jgi:hypothetical protein